ncbi:hypothetical protein PT273_08930 [Orbaceae bacterium ESL0727]|nr:hypothetical protein [Orbaceae bacterium ESL0727]MDF7667962.1 hypothetical protein [Orbaceae bacterium ESL0727]
MEKNDLLMSLQGPINLAKRNTSATPNRPGAFRHVGVADSCEMELSVDTVQQNESYTGQRLQVGELTLGKNGTLNMTLKDWSIENLALALYGEVITVASGIITDEALPSGLVIGDRIKLTHSFVADVELKNASSATLVEGTDYIVESAPAGLIKLLTTVALTATVDYSYAKTESLGIFTRQPPERWFMLDGINTDQEDSHVIVELFRVKFNPVSNFTLLHNEGYGELPLTATVLADMTQTKDSTLGYFGSYTQKAE